MAKVAEYKKKLVEDMVKLMRQYSMIGVVDMNNLPAPQLQSMRSELRGKINLFMTKKRLMKIALEKIKNEKKHIEELEKYLDGMPALIFANENPFKLSRTLQKSKTSAPAKAGQIAPNDIIVNKGPTPFAPGPIISELSSVGLKVGVESGKVAVKEDTVVAKKGEKIKPKVAEILTRLNIKPMQVGLGMVAAYENEIIYQKDVLEIDEKAFNEKVNLAATQAFNFAFNITYVTKDNINPLIAKAFNDAKALGISQKILDKGIIEQLLSKAEMEMLSLKTSANIETKVQEIKEESKPKEGPEVKEEPKVEEKKIEAPIQEKVEKKEEKVLEEEKKIIEEEKKLEKEKPKGALVEKEVQEAVKEEEEKKLEKERIEKEKELEKIEEQKEEVTKKEEQVKEEKPKEDVDKKVKIMVEQTKKFAKGKEETAADILKEVKKEEQKEKEEEKIQQQEKEEYKEQVPTTHDLKKQKEGPEKPENKEDKDRKEVEELTKELLKKGTLRKK